MITENQIITRKAVYIYCVVMLLLAVLEGCQEEVSFTSDLNRISLLEAPSRPIKIENFSMRERLMMTSAYAPQRVQTLEEE